MSSAGTVPTAYGAAPATFARTPAQRRLRAQILVVLVGAWVGVPRLLQSLTAPKYRLAIGADRAPYTAVAGLSLDVLLLAALGFAALMVLEALADPPHGRFALVAVMVAPWLWLTVRDWTGGTGPGPSSLLYPLVVMALWTLRPGVEVLRTIAWVVAAVLVVSVLLALVVPAKGIYLTETGDQVGQDKQLVPIGILIGVFTQGNNFAQFVLLGLPLLGTLRHRRVRFGLVALAVFAMVWSASRSCLVGLAFCAAAGAVLAVLPRDRRRVVGALVVLAPTVLVGVLPLVTRDQTAFTARGFIWINSLKVWAQAPVVGHGSDWYDRAARTSARLGNTVYHGHNQYVQLLVTGGVVLVVLVTLLVVLALRNALRWLDRGSTVGVLWLVALAGACLLEVSMVYVDNVAFFPVFVLPLAMLLFADTTTIGAPAAGPRVTV